MNRKIISLIMCLCLIALFQIPGIAYAEINLSDISEITIDTGGDDMMPSTCLYRNEIWMVWQSSSEDITSGTDQDIVVNNYNGETWGDTEEISSQDNSGADTNPTSIVFNNELYVAWATNDVTDSTGSDWDIVMRSHDGIRWGSVIDITDVDDSGDDYHPQFCEYQGKLYVAWQTWDNNTSDGEDADIVMKVFDGTTLPDEGASWSSVAKPMIGDEGDDYSPQLQVFNDLMYLVWSTDDKVSNGTDFDILSRSFDGNQWNPAVELTSISDNDDDLHPYTDVIDGKLYVLWQTVDDTISTGKDDDIVMRIYDGESWGGILEITSPDILGHKDDGSDTFPLLASYQGGVFVIWQTNDPVTSSGNDWDMVLSFHNGDKWSQITEFTQVDDTGNDGGIYASGMDAIVFDDKLYIIWQTKDTTTSTDGDWDLVMLHCTEDSVDNGTGPNGGSDNTMLWTMLIIIGLVVAGVSIRQIKKRKPDD